MNKMSRQWKRFYASLIVLLVTWGLFGILGIDDYIGQVQQNSNSNRYLSHNTPIDMPVSEAIQHLPFFNYDDWVERIKKEAEKKRIAPVDAKLDRVWKAIPGYNGLEVDLAKTIQLSRFSAAEEPIHFVYKEVKPKVNLEDLGPYPIYKGNPRKPMVSLMINVAWGNEFIPTMLRVLNKENVHATFFFDGSWLLQNLDVAKQIGLEGHELSNHAYSHKNMSQLSRKDVIAEISKTQRLLTEKLGVDNKLFAPPSGDFNEQTVQIAHELQLKTVLWTIDTVDWTKPDPGWVVRKVAKSLEPGAMILMHPTLSSSSALEAMIKEIKQRGFVLGTVSELLSTDRVSALQTIR
jgi:probable sporulation protein (polysaccharide deacetylase family)